MMSEPETKVEIEDVLSSIRRLVSRDAGAVRSITTAPRVAAPVVAPVPAPQPVEADCLVLTPALRIEEAEEVALMAPPMPEPEAEIETEVETALTTTFEAVEAAEAEAVAEAEIVASVLQDLAAPALPEAEDADELPEALATEADTLDDEAPLLLSDADLTAAPSAFDDAAPLLLQPSEAVAPAEILTFVPPMPPRPMTEAERLLAEAEAALLETGAVLDDASSAIDAVGEAEALSDVAEEVPLAATDLGDELSRLESTIAELEAAVAESGFDFEPDTGHPFDVAEAEMADDVPEAFEAEVRQAIEAPLMDDLPMPELAAEPQAEPVEEAPLDLVAEAAVSASAEAWAEDAAEEAAEAFDATFDARVEEEVLAQQEFAAAAQAEMTDPEETAQPSAEDSGVGMDWAEATLNLARRTPPRRLAVSEAEETVQTAAAMRSSYEELRDELTENMADPDALYAEDLVPSYEDGLIDEAVLRDMVAQLVREELRGSLGERITQNVRKLVRREIQRALMGQDFE